MNAVLNWRTVTPSNSPRYLVSGTELSVAFACGHRFAIYEIRCRDAEGQADRYYVVRDAEAISDADLKAGKRPPIGGQTNDYDKLLAFVEREQAARDARLADAA